MTSRSPADSTIRGRTSRTRPVDSNFTRHGSGDLYDAKRTKSPRRTVSPTRVLTPPTPSVGQRVRKFRYYSYVQHQHYETGWPRMDYYPLKLIVPKWMPLTLIRMLNFRHWQCRNVADAAIQQTGLTPSKDVVVRATYLESEQPQSCTGTEPARTVIYENVLRSSMPKKYDFADHEYGT